MAIKFNQPIRHGTIQFLPGVAVAFADPDAAPYFVAAGWAEETGDAPVFTYDEGAVRIDPLTRFAETGQYVQPEVAQAHLAAHDGNPPPPPQDLSFNSGLIAPAPEA